MPRRGFYLCMGLLAVLVAVVGFAGTFFVPLATGRFVALPYVYLHGAAFFGWVVLFAVQAWLIRSRRHRAHRRLGWAATLLAATMTVSGVLVGVQAMHRDVAAGGGDTAVSGLVGTCTAMAIFALLFGLAVGYRRRPEAHKRLMLLATIAVLWPAWFRLRHYFPGVPFPEIVFAIVMADGLVVAAMLHDWCTRRRVHAVWMWGGGALIVEHCVEAMLFDTPGWRRFAHMLADLLA